MAEVTTLVTADELLAMPDDGWRYEIRAGQLIRMSPAGAEHGDVAGEFLARLRPHVREHKLVRVFAAETASASSIIPTPFERPTSPSCARGGFPQVASRPATGLDHHARPHRRPPGRGPAAQAVANGRACRMRRPARGVTCAAGSVSTATVSLSAVKNSIS